MQTVEKKQSQKTVFKEINFEMIDAINCLQIREKLDAVFGGISPLEETSAGVKRDLFAHLETCRDCCRSFDVRVRFRTASRDTIF
jgi:hypothetical protein